MNDQFIPISDDEIKANFQKLPASLRDRIKPPKKLTLKEVAIKAKMEGSIYPRKFKDVDALQAYARGEERTAGESAANKAPPPY